MPKRKMAKTYPMVKLDEALHKRFGHNYITEWNIIHGAYVTSAVLEKGKDVITADERIFIDGYMAAVTDCMYGGALK